MTGASFLYPHLRGDDPTPGHEGLDNELASLALAGWREGVELDERTLVANSDSLDRATALLVDTVEHDGRVMVLGNGGSASDALRFSRLLGSTVDAITLTDPAVITALANDLGAGHIFSRQIEAFAGSGDVAVAFTTSGQSANVVTALETAHRCGSRTIAFAGYGGGALLGHPDVDVCFVVDSTSVHRIQEAQGRLCDELAERVTKTRKERP